MAHSCEQVIILNTYHAYPVARDFAATITNFHGIVELGKPTLHYFISMAQ